MYSEGMEPVLLADGDAPEGKRCLFIEARDPADVAVGQTVLLRVGALYRVSCSIRSTLRVYAVNSTERPLPVKLLLEGFSGPIQGGQVHVLRDTSGSGSAEVLNSRDEPERVRAVSSPAEFRGNRFEVKLEPFSLTLFELEVARS